MSKARRLLWLAVAAVLQLVFLTCSGDDGGDDEINVVVTASNAANVTTNSAYVVVTYNPVKGAEILEVGVVYGKLVSRLSAENIMAHNGVNTADFGVVKGLVSASYVFDADLTGLDDNTTYYYKPYVKIDKTTDRTPNGYYVESSYKQFKTEPDSRPLARVDTVVGVSRNGATFNGTVVKPGAHPDAITKGFCYGAAENPRKGVSTCDSVSATTTFFSRTVSGLTENTTYYVCAYIDNGVDTTQYSAAKKFKTLASTPPSVSIGEVAVTSGTAATFTATFVEGDPKHTEKGFCYGETQHPAVDDGISKVVPVTATANPFTLPVSDLKNVTRYFVRAYIDNGVTVVYSEEKEFTTPFTDPRDGRTYKVEAFGSAVWMIEDFRYNSSTGLYTWSEAMGSNIPEGWHLPNNNEWAALRSALGGSANTSKYFVGGRWWSASPDPGYPNYAYSVYNSDGILGWDDDRLKSYNFYVRYVKDN